MYLTFCNNRSRDLKTCFVSNAGDFSAIDEDISNEPYGLKAEIRGIENVALTLNHRKFTIG